MDAWGIDVIVSAIQKGLGAPPGLSVVVASQKALNVRIYRIHSLIVALIHLSRHARSLTRARRLFPLTTLAGSGACLRVLRS